MLGHLFSNPGLWILLSLVQVVPGPWTAVRILLCICDFPPNPSYHSTLFFSSSFLFDASPSGFLLLLGFPLVFTCPSFQ